ncbi:ribonuclease P protein component [Paracoccus sp. (in: a-proteobacteria)]|uniref:ribonuclease P protein component n=1 Tax=Paracoccus sp. TaxID=267 RepID=UPI0026DEBDB8|nr:ribonuclease P protein component [Paracoccus sp. (in: a-proteobacteria)]MDO5648107.1 ribonuclease P protein component [Paracoccus sp. (in: a-proteobacteria)]
MEKPLPILQKRADFVAAARARRQGTPAFLLQARARGDDGPPRVGFTCSKKVGNAVARNRAKRRLREIARLEMNGRARNGWDYVLIGRAELTATRPFDALRADLVQALRKVHS